MNYVLTFLGFLAIIAICWWLHVLLFVWAWNYVMPLMWAHAPHITFWQGFAATLLLGAMHGVRIDPPKPA